MPTISSEKVQLPEKVLPKFLAENWQALQQLCRIVECYPKKEDHGSSHFLQLRTLLRHDEMAQGRVPARLALHFSEKIPRKAEDVDEMEYSPLFLVPSTKLNIVDAFFLFGVYVRLLFNYFAKQTLDDI